MNLPIACRALVFCLLCSQSLADTDVQPFTATSLAQVQHQFQGRPFILVLWSLHCAPCFAELAMLGRELISQPDLPLVLVSADAHATQEDVQMLLEDYGLQNLPSWQFAGDFPEALRYHIDPDWYGELPRSYFYNAAHERRSHSGQLSRAMLAQWLTTKSGI